MRRRSNALQLTGGRGKTNVGARSPEQVDGWIDAANLELSAVDLHDIVSTLLSSDVHTPKRVMPRVARSSQDLGYTGNYSVSHWVENLLDSH